jgi:hypothetical protein
MKDWIRRVKGGIGMGLTWAAGWMPIGALTGLALWVVLKPAVAFGVEPVRLGRLIISNALFFGALGFVAGSIFAAVLRLAEGRHRFDELTLPRFAAWGGVAGLLLGGTAAITIFIPGLQLVNDTIVASVATLLGAGSAAGSLAIARKAEDYPVTATPTKLAHQ